MTRRRNPLHDNNGYAMLAAILVVSLILVSGLAILGRATTEQRLSKSQVDLERASYVAMAGLEACMGNVVWDPTFPVDVTEPLPTGPVCDEIGGHGDATYTATAHWFTTDEIEIRSVGLAGPASRQSRRVAVARLKRPQNVTTVPDPITGQPTHSVGFGDADLQSYAWGGGNFYLAANAPFRGDLLVRGTITLEGSATYCGELYATGTIQLNGAAAPITGCTEAVLQGGFADIGFPPFFFDKSLAHHEITPAGGKFKPICPSPTGDFAAYRDHELCDGPTEGVRVIWVNGEIYLDKYQPTGGGASADEYIFTGNLLYIATGKVTVTNNTMVKYPAGDESSRIQFVSLHDNQQEDHPDLSAILLAGNKEEDGSNTVFAGTWVAPVGNVTTKNAEIRGLVFGENWYAQGPTTYLGQGRLWTTVQEAQDQDQSLPSESEETSTEDEGWEIIGLWHE